MSVELLTPLDPPSFVDPAWFSLESRPLLKLAAANKRRANSVRVEWLVDYFEAGVLKHKALSNYTQILRQHFQRRWLVEESRRQTLAEAAQEAGEKILDAAEITLWYGRPILTLDSVCTLSTCGGVLYYLKRRLYENDSVALCELRCLTLLLDRAEGDEFRAEEDRTHEWIWEFSLQVTPGHYERGMKPICLPPTKSAVKAWAQGTSLGGGS